MCDENSLVLEMNEPQAIYPSELPDAVLLSADSLIRSGVPQGEAIVRAICQCVGSAASKEHQPELVA